MSNHADAIKQAETVHAEMVARLASAREALAANDARRHGLALAVETADMDAKREASALTKAAASLREDIDRLTHAVDQASQRVTAARLDADAEAKREAAAKARAISTRLAARGAQLDAALDQVRQGYADFQADLRELVMLGAPAPSANLIETNSRRTLNTAIEGIHTKTRPVRPSQRHTFDELLRGWALPSERWAAGILDAPAKVDSAA
jgi:colicin import membrane protein